MHRWPLILRRGPLTLRPAAFGDRAALAQLKADNAAWLEAWKIGEPDPEVTRSEFRRWVRHYRAAGKDGTALALIVEVGGEIAGQLVANPITAGASASATLGYWIAKRHAGQGIMPLAVAMLIDYLVGELAVRRIEVNVRPENHASVRVVEKLGFLFEGIARQLLYVDAAWRDHARYALIASDIPPAGLAEFVQRGTKLQ